MNVKSIVRNLLLTYLILLVLGWQPVFADEDYFAMSLEKLLKQDITLATLSAGNLSKVPASVTIINSDDIKYTPARNIYDLLEVYVPGAMWRYHGEGPHPGIRGILTDRNYKLLLLVNGRNMNQKAHNGATSELENWDLNDIEKIEIIRGPGSVTYGPGAIMGVINIVTKNAKSSEGTDINVDYVSEYDSKGVSISHGLIKDKFDLFVYGSFRKTDGISPKAYLTSASALKSGYMGTGFTGSAYSSNPPQDYFSDVDDDPQYKLYAECNFLNEWKAWARYVNSGAPVAGGSGVYPKVQYQIGLDGETPLYSDFENTLRKKNKHFTVALENDHEFSNVLDGLQLKSMVSWDSESFMYGKLPTRYSAADNVPLEIQSQLADPDSVRNKGLSGSEDELLVRTIATLKINDKYQTALGFEYSYNHWGPEWGKSGKEMRLGDQRNIISGTGSHLYGGKGGITEGYFVGDGWSTNTFSVLGEATMKFHPKFTLMLSGRNDKNTYSKNLFSPRIAAISELNERNIVKLIWQESKRMNTAEQLLVEHMEGYKSDPEVLTSYELIYTRLQGEHLLFDISLFYNQLDVIAWDGSKKSSQSVGDLKLGGLECEARYQSERFIVGINHSYVKQLDWDLAQGVDYSGISYSDYKVPGQLRWNPTGLTLNGTGNNLNNWANHATKAYFRYKFLNNKLIFHADARIFWGYEGGKDGFQMIRNAVKGTKYEQEVLEVLKRIEDKDVFDPDFRLNASLTWKLSDVISLQLYSMNLLDIGNNKRYTYDAGFDQLVPNSTSWIEEPRTFGMKLTMEF